MIKSARWIVLGAAALATSVGAQQEPSEVTDKEIARYKQNARNACREPGIAKGDPPERVDAFCSCVIATLDKTMKRAEWQQVYFHWMKKDETQEQAVLDPHIRNFGHCVPKP